MSKSKLPLFILLLLAFIDLMSVGLVYPMFSTMIFNQEHHFLPLGTSEVSRGFWLGILLAAAPLAQFFTAPIIGTLSDQLGRKLILKITLIITMGGYLLCVGGTLWESLYLLLVGRFIIGIGTGSAAIVNAAVADLSSPEEKTKNFALISMAMGVGFTIGPFLGGVFSRWGFDKPFIFSGIITFINLILLIFYFQETHHLRKKGELSFSLGIKNLKKALHIPGVHALFLSFFFFFIGWSYYWEFIPVTWIQGYGLTTSQVANFYAYGAAFYAISCGLLIRPVVDRVKPLPLFFSGLILLSLFIFLLLPFSRVELFWGYVPIQQFLLALLFPTAFTIASNSVKEDAQGEIMGVVQSIEAFAFVAAPLLAGVFVGVSYNMPIFVGGGSMFIAAIVLLMGYKKEIFKIKE